MPPLTQEERISTLELNHGVLEANIHGRLEAIDSKLQVLLDGTGGHCKTEEMRVDRLEDIARELQKNVKEQIEKREEQLKTKCDQADFDGLVQNIRWLWTTIAGTLIVAIITASVSIGVHNMVQAALSK